MQTFFEDDRVNVGNIQANTDTQDGVPYTIRDMEEPDYVMRRMATGWQRLFVSGWTVV